MTNNNRRGADAERVVAEKLNKWFPHHNFKRIGGVERRKNTYPGDIHCVPEELDKKTRRMVQKCKWGWDCWSHTLYFEIKKRKGLRVPSWWKKTNDDAPTNRIPFLIYYHWGNSRTPCDWYVKDSTGTHSLDEWCGTIHDTYVADEEETE